MKGDFEVTSNIKGLFDLLRIMGECNMEMSSVKQILWPSRANHYKTQNCSSVTHQLNQSFICQYES